MPSSISDYTLETNKEVEKKVDVESALPIYYEQLKLEKAEKDRISKEIFDEFEELKKERDDEKLEEKWDALDNQYEGKTEEDSRRMFNLCRKVTKVKVNRIVNKIMKAFMQSDPKYAVTPRPEFMKQGGIEICDKQSDFVDYKLDNLPFRGPEGRAVHSAVLKGTGWLKVYHCIKREKRKREESYKGTPKVVGVDQKTGQPMIKNDGLEEFLRNWPDAPKDYPMYIQKLSEGKEIKIVAEYTETTYNDPAFKNIDLKDFYCRISTEGYEGLKTTKLTVERQKYSYWDLKKEEKKGFFEDIDELIYDDKEKKKKINKAENLDYNILECVFYTKLKDSDDDEVKCVFWVSEEKKVIIGSIMYPYYGIDCYYVPHYICDKVAGIYQPGVGEDLTDSNIAENAILNHVLESAWMKNLITPIVPEGSDIQKQFLEKTWTHGIPLTVNPGEEVDFLQKYMPQTDIGGLINLLQYLIQGDDDVTGVSSLMSGRESPIDPQAPAQKTLALLAESGENIAEYITSMAPAFNTIGEIILQMYFQMSTDGVDYQPKPERVVGDNPFNKITRAEMIAKTNIQVQASSFAFDALEENKKDLALYQIMRTEPLVARNPESVYIFLKNIIKKFSPKWAVLVDTVLPSPQDFKKELTQTAVQAVAMFVQKTLMDAKMTGQAPQFDPRQLLTMISEMTAEVATPPSPEVVKEREANAKSVS
jgi:hypothetical protein